MVNASSPTLSTVVEEQQFCLARKTLVLVLLSSFKIVLSFFLQDSCKFLHYESKNGKLLINVWLAFWKLLQYPLQEFSKMIKIASMTAMTLKALNSDSAVCTNSLFTQNFSQHLPVISSFQTIFMLSNRQLFSRTLIIVNTSSPTLTTVIEE